MTITRRVVGRVAVLDLAGRLTLSPNDAEIAPLRAALSGLIAEGHTDMALDVARVCQIDAHGLGELAFMLKTVRGVGGHLALIAPSERLGRMLSVTRLDRCFDRCEDNADLAGAPRSAPRDYGAGRIAV